MIRTTILALMAGTIMVGATFAQTAPQSDQVAERPHPILHLDQNDDGQISREEAQTMGQNPMARADANGDGTVSRDEAIAAAVKSATRQAGAMFDRFDEDDDGQIAVETLPEPRGHGGDRVGRMFERFDTDDDGVLSADEIADIPAHGPRGKGDHGKRGHENRHGDRG